MLLVIAPSGAAAQGQDAGTGSVFLLLDGKDLFYLAILALFMGAALIAAVLAFRGRAEIAAERDELKGRLATAQSELDDRAAILATAGECILVPDAEGGPRLVGALPEETGAPADPDGFCRFREWLDDRDATRIEDALRALVFEARSFRLEVETQDGALLEASGRTRGGTAFARFVGLAGLREELSRVNARETMGQATIETLQNLFDSGPMPVWLRDPENRLLWVNQAYARAVGASDVADALEHQREFLGEKDRAEVAASVAGHGLFFGDLTTVAGRERRHFTVAEALGPSGAAGYALDISEAEKIRDELKQTVDAQSDMLDQLTTAVARFDEHTRLVYYNAEMQRLFDLSATFLESRPDHLTLLDHLRSRDILPAEKYFRSELREKDLAAYRAAEQVQSLWHLTDGRHLRVIATPQPKGGATWIFEDITKNIELEAQVQERIRLQRETIDSLSEGVAVFGGDGRLRLSNPAFAQLFGLPEEFLKTRPRVHNFAETATIEILPVEGGDPAGWSYFATAITAFDTTGRDSETGEIALASGQIVTYAIVPLPNGQTMLTFADVSDARKAERALREKNEALEEANQIKTDFVQHVNYELRSPLTNIIGFSALLRSTEVGPLNERQNEYLGYISSETAALLTIVNDILDLATIDAGIMKLDVSEVDIARTVDHAVEGVRDRLGANDIDIEVDLEKAGDTFEADGGRLTQILFNLLSNAANFAPQGSHIVLKAVRGPDTISFSVADDGPGIPPERLERLFDRFEAHPEGGRSSGAGLGLSIVKSFIELHRGRISVSSQVNRGTVVTCIFPLIQSGPDRPDPEKARDNVRYRDAAQ